MNIFNVYIISQLYRLRYVNIYLLFNCYKNYIFTFYEHIYNNKWDLFCENYASQFDKRHLLKLYPEFSYKETDFALSYEWGL